MARRPSPRCSNCGRSARRLHPCPCGLGGHCSNPNGVCSRCEPVIERNAIVRAYEASTDRIGAGWREQAACRNRDTALFFAEDKDKYTDTARAVCRGCPARWDCLDDALDTHDGFGMRAGLTVKDRRNIRRARTQPGHGTRAKYIQGCRC